MKIYTDGSCIGNPGPGGWAAILLKEREEKVLRIIKGRELKTTNNRMEMIAVIEALRFIHENDLQKKDVTLYSDSNLIVQTINKGWKKKANLDLWQELNALIEEIEVTFVWIRGHAQNKWNEECDKIAVTEAKKAQSGI